LPIFLDPDDGKALRDRLPFNQSFEYPPSGDAADMNVVQAIQFTQATIANDSASQTDKALAYSWLFHLVGDIHQPLHAVSLVSVNKFPQGDRSGNRIPLRRGRNLHALWDGLLGRGNRIRDVDREVAEMSERYRDARKSVAGETDPQKWAEESRQLAESFAYSDTILNVVRSTPRGVELSPIELPTEYMREAGDHARRRIAMAGIRLGALLKNNQ
jgi:hypothetical protein